MKKSKFTDEQITYALKQAMLGTPVTMANALQNTVAGMPAQNWEWIAASIKIYVKKSENGNERY